MAKVRPTRDMELGRHARKAIQAIRDRGHTIRTEENDKGNVCLIGAVRKVVAPMGNAKAGQLVNDFNARFGEWMTQNHPTLPEVQALICQFTSVSVSIPATTWNDRILLHEEEACAWLGKFADAMDPQRP
jgi:hypothetical protein